MTIQTVKALYPKPLRRALLTYARAVRLAENLAGIPHPDPLTLYHTREYLDVMEDLLVDQLVTLVPTQDERKALLSVAGLEHLAGRVGERAAELGEEE